MRISLLIMGVVTLLGLGACSESDVGSQSHVWEEQVDTIDTAREVENTLKQALDSQLTSIEGQVD